MRSLSKRKILLVEGNQDGTIGGSHHSLLLIIKALDKKKYELTVMFYEHNKVIEKFNIEKCNTVVFDKPLGKTFTPPNAILKLPYLIVRKFYNFISTSFIPFIKFCFFLKRNKIDLVHLNNSSRTGWDWLLAAKLLGIKCIAHQRGFVEFSHFTRRVARLFDRIISISNAIEVNLNKNGLKDNVVTIYNAIDVSEFKNRVAKQKEYIKEKLGIDQNSYVIGIVGNFQEWKGQNVAVRAVEQLKKKYPKIICLLVGDVSSTYKKDKEYYNKVKRVIDENNLGKNIIITGYRSDIPDLINSFDIMIHASTKPEPFGRVIIEGMSIEKPVIATDMGGAKEIVENGISGILVPPNEPDKLAAKIEYLLEHPHLRNEIVANALIRVKEIFGFNHFVREINSLYKQILR